MLKRPVSGSGENEMQGTQSKDADMLYRGILDYYAGISGLEITKEQMERRDKFIVDAVLLCDDSLDETVLSIQERFVMAAGNSAEQNLIIEELISLLDS
jgi:hypothetical protein